MVGTIIKTQQPTMTLKQKTYNHCLHLINEKIEELKKTMNQLSEGIKDDSKSSAGDKHETSRAMAQIEQEKTANQLNQTLQQKTELQKLETTHTSPQIAKGSLVKTNTMYLYISVALGKITIDGITVFAISPQSPLGTKLMGLKPNDTAQLNGTKYFIETIE